MTYAPLINYCNRSTRDRIDRGLRANTKNRRPAFAYRRTSDIGEIMKNALNMAVASDNRIRREIGGKARAWRPGR
jgi:hypothetical protein